MLFFYVLWKIIHCLHKNTSNKDVTNQFKKWPSQVVVMAFITVEETSAHLYWILVSRWIPSDRWGHTAVNWTIPAAPPPMTEDLSSMCTQSHWWGKHLDSVDKQVDFKIKFQKYICLSRYGISNWNLWYLVICWVTDWSFESDAISQARKA